MFLRACSLSSAIFQISMKENIDILNAGVHKYFKWKAILSQERGCAKTLLTKNKNKNNRTMSLKELMPLYA